MDFNGQGGKCLPTTELPGSWGKVEVLHRRVRRRERLWHPLDAKMPHVRLTPDVQIIPQEVQDKFADDTEGLHKAYLELLGRRINDNSGVGPGERTLADVA